ncbi:polysaccharide biosynthesis/export family protein [Segetibacter aerophilus]|uniref:Polysaccharide export protein, BexD/CtrA/VexA family n=1 Tax=Segetibacter aerophilus TaxID=670293 RepID=A0A512BES0_9BACT|nr:polysaccharide biosynthesis/export family protein [Segetibacter aerophilus]GEO10461.1 polysaccharide export protein, BexD/CtrA/VexA family [Segetibacter aerophilus]
MILKKEHSSFVFLAALSSSLIIFLSSCSTTKSNAEYLYFQGAEDNVAVQQKETIIQPRDLLSIQVYSKTLNQEQAAIFNIFSSSSSLAPSTASAGASSTSGNAGASQGYEVSAFGNIEMPVIGTVKAAGLTKDQLQALLVEKISNYVKSPSIVVRFSNYSINILGEVRSPGSKRFTVDKVTLIDAISAAGDLTEFGKRENVMVIREQGGKKYYNTVDIRSKNLFSSPVYVLQPNDIVYVSPNNKRLKTLNADVETQRKISVYLSYVGIAISLISVFIYLRR